MADVNVSLGQFNIYLIFVCLMYASNSSFLICHSDNGNHLCTHSLHLPFKPMTSDVIAENVIASQSQ